MTTVYVGVPHGLSIAMDRVADALTRHAPPGVSVVRRADQAQLVILHVIGMTGLASEIARIQARGQAYALVQYCLRTTEHPDTRAWRALWRGAAAVWSYYDLAALAREDGAPLDLDVDIRWHYAPLGVDAQTFRPAAAPLIRNYTLLTSGYIAESECVLEAATAVQRVGGNLFHLGPKLAHLPGAIRFESGLSDARLVNVYRSCHYVAGLRRDEGFELPAAEGLLCGARPICLDRPHYRQWFEPWAEFVPEGTFRETTDALERVLREPVRPVTDDEIDVARARFDWATVVSPFWTMALASAEVGMVTHA